jgi:quercetin dioxygenase-like cupin family protein
MHRTVTIDYAVVLSGEIVLQLDNGEEKTLHAGDTLVQGGANHAWVNRADAPCRMLFVMLAAEKIVTKDGTVLEEAGLKR